VFYDDFEKGGPLGQEPCRPLGGYLPKQMPICRDVYFWHYVQKAWPQHERQHAQARALVAKEEYISAVRFDDTAVPGLTSAVGHIDLRKTTSKEANRVDFGEAWEETALSLRKRACRHLAAEARFCWRLQS